MTTAPETGWPAAPADPPRRRTALIVMQVAYAAFLPLWFAISIAATMGLANTPEWWAPPALLAVWLYPLVALVAVIGSHVLHTRHPRAARCWNLLPLPWLLAGLALLTWVAIEG